MAPVRAIVVRWRGGGRLAATGIEFVRAFAVSKPRGASAPEGHVENGFRLTCGAWGML